MRDSGETVERRTRLDHARKYRNGANRERCGETQNGPLGLNATWHGEFPHRVKNPPVSIDSLLRCFWMRTLSTSRYSKSVKYV
jgi:hypothetical protein